MSIDNIEDLLKRLKEEQKKPKISREDLVILEEDISRLRIDLDRFQRLLREVIRSYHIG